MAKSSRASSRKANNQRLKKNVFGPIESARAERLSTKLLELAAQPKPKEAGKENEMEGLEAADGMYLNRVMRVTALELTHRASRTDGGDLD